MSMIVIKLSSRGSSALTQIIFAVPPYIWVVGASVTRYNTLGGYHTARRPGTHFSAVRRYQYIIAQLYRCGSGVGVAIWASRCIPVLDSPYTSCTRKGLSI